MYSIVGGIKKEGRAKSLSAATAKTMLATKEDTVVKTAVIYVDSSRLIGRGEIPIDFSFEESKRKFSQLIVDFENALSGNNLVSIESFANCVLEQCKNSKKILSKEERLRILAILSRAKIKSFMDSRPEGFYIYKKLSSIKKDFSNLFCLG